MPTSKKPKRRLSKLNVEYISLVDNGANQREVIYKNADVLSNGREVVKKQILFRKTDDEKRIVMGVVYAPDEVDAHGDTMAAESIEKAAHEFLAAGKTNRVDKQHDENPDKGFIVESSILKGEHPDFPDDPEGTWIVAIKVTDDATWEEIKKGDIKGISMQGYAEAEQLEDEEEVIKADSITDAINHLKDWIRKNFAMNKTANEERPVTFNSVLKQLVNGTLEIAEHVKKDFESSLGSEELRQAIYALDSANWNAMHDEDVSDKKAQLAENAQQFIDHLSGLTVSKQQTNTEDATMSEPNKEEKVEKTGGDNPVLEAIETFKTEVLGKIEGLENRVQTIEKAAPGSQAGADQDEEPVKKEYNPKAPISFGLED